MDENFDFSKAFEQLQEMLSSDEGQSQIQNLLGKLSSEDNQKPDIPQGSLPFETDGIDFNMISKLSGVIQAMNSPENSSKTAFLNTLKPFLKESRQKKLDQATRILKLASVFKILKETDKGGV